MKAPILFVIVFLIHVIGISGFALMQGCATRQPIEGTATPNPRTTNPDPAFRPVAPVLPPKPGASVAAAPRPVVKPYVPPAPRNIVPPPAPVKPVAPQPVNTPSYKVAKGDSLSKIAKRHGVSTRELAAFNGINDPNKIRIGQTLYLPGNAKSSASGGVEASVKPRVAKPSAKGDYVVRAGDSLSRIAAKNGTTVQALKKANALTSDRILVGQVLALPGGTTQKRSAHNSKEATARPPRAVKKPTMETIAIKPVPPTTIVKEPVKAPVVKETPVAPATTDADTSVLDQSFEYTVQEGETLRDISNAFIVSSDDILKINNLSSEAAIRPGMKLKIPPSEF